MIRKGKYTKPVTPVRQAKREARRGFRWWREMSLKKKIAVIVVPILVILIIIPLATYLYFARDISNKERLMNRNNTGIVLYANDGKTEIYSQGRAKHRELIELDKIAPSTQKALIASEDKNFYKHDGFSLGSMLGAVYANFIAGGKSFGGSTLTQQLAKNTLLSSDKNYLRKFQELSIAIAIERTYSKDEILSMYLNSVYFGENSFGIQDAAKTYFNKSPAELSLAESAMLIGVLPAPSAYSPISGNPEYAKERQGTVLKRMVANGFITEAEKNAALGEELVYAEVKSPSESSKAPHFTEMVMNELYKKYGEEKVTRSGYQVTTTLDAGLQGQLQESVAGNMNTIRRGGGSNASAVAIDPTTGEIRGLVGSYDWSDEKFGKVNMVTTARQPGSSFKPLYYAQALADGVITPATILKDTKPTASEFGGYAPQNADRRFRGDVTVRNALNWSLNIPSIKVMQQLGIDKSIDAAKRMGITTLDSKKDYGLPLALGSAEVPLLEMTSAYSGFANAGQRYNTSIIKGINSKYNDKVFVAKNDSSQAISEQGAYLISNILSDNSSRSTVFGNSLTVYGKNYKAIKAAVKTGTTDDSRDAWTIGYTPQIAIGVWVGNNDNTTMTNGGAGMAGPIWTKAMGKVLADVSSTDFPIARGIVQKNICADGSLADAAVAGKTRTEYFISTSLPTSSCSVKPTENKTEEKKDREEDTESEESTPVATKISVTTSPSGSSALGASVTFSALLTSAVKGTVTFKDGGSTLSVVTASGGSASFTTSSLTVGPHTITAEFTPEDTSAYTSSSSSVSHTVTASGSTGPGANNGNSQRNN